MSARDELEQLFRQESGQVLASLIRSLGDFDLAQDALQEAVVTALDRWPRDGVPGSGGTIGGTAGNVSIHAPVRVRRTYTITYVRGAMFQSTHL